MAANDVQLRDSIYEVGHHAHNSEMAEELTVDRDELDRVVACLIDFFRRH